MIFQPHSYQSFAVDFILSHPIAAILLDMGLGKTVITLSAIEQLIHDRYEVSRVLVIAPLRVAAMTWPNEIRQWEHLSSLTYTVAVGTPQERRAAVLQDAEITIINRENLPWLLSSGLPLRYDMAVIDELSSFKNPQSKRFKAFMRLRPKLSRVVGLTGTPSSNGLMDLFAEYKCMDMGQRLGRFIGRYRDAYFSPDRRNGNIVYSYKPRPGAEQQIYEKIRDITVSMKALDHLPMPALLRNRYPVRLSEEERSRYRSLCKDLVLSLGPGGRADITAANAAALSTKLCQLANGCIYSDDGTALPFHTRKLDALEDLVESAQSPVLVVYWYRHDLSRIRERLTGMGIVFDELKTPAAIEAWNRGALQVGLIHPASAGHGLNLQQGGHHIIWYGLTWSLELYEQVNARLWRQGQQARTVVVTHIVTENTIDERILAALGAKSQTQDALIAAVKAELASSQAPSPSLPS
ncbi:MAG: DEAD/DEAH box helicase [Oscillospiraceae bacterium]|nr:DEAD/DEAH box helicase [Oscillospiraceae bacterium]